MTIATKHTLFKAGKGLTFIGFIYLLQYFTDSNVVLLSQQYPFLFWLFIAGVADAIRDKCAHHYHKSILNALNKQWWDASISWKNKYKYQVKWHGITIQYVPVVFTDAWHFFKGIHTIALILAVLSFNGELSLLTAFVCYTAYKLPFTAFYSYYLNRFNNGQ